jgi:hypothetical protein
LVLRLNISSKKRTSNTRKGIFSWPAQHLHVAGRWANCIPSVVKTALLLTCAVIFLLQEDFFSVATPRA